MDWTRDSAIRRLYPEVKIIKPDGKAFQGDGITEVVVNQSDIDAEILVLKSEEKKQDVKNEANKRIVAVLPEWKQRNYTARSVELTEKIATGGTLTTDEQTELTNIKGLWAQVKDIRNKSDTLEASIDGMTPEQVEDLVVKDNSHWP